MLGVDRWWTLQEKGEFRRTVLGGSIKFSNESFEDRSGPTQTTMIMREIDIRSPLMRLRALYRAFSWTRGHTRLWSIGRLLSWIISPVCNRDLFCNRSLQTDGLGVFFRNASDANSCALSSKRVDLWVKNSARASMVENRLASLCG